MADGTVFAEALTAGKRPLTGAESQLVAALTAQMRGLARSVARTRDADEHDLMQTGLEVACRMVGAFDGNKAKFLTFIWPRARGAMLDLCVKDRSTRDMARSIQRAATLAQERIEAGDLFAETPEQRERRYKTARSALAAASMLGLCSAPPTPEESLETHQQLARLKALVQSVLETLDPTDRALLECVIVEDTTIADAARAVELPYPKAHYRFYEALELFDRRVRVRMKAERG